MAKLLAVTQCSAVGHTKLCTELIVVQCRAGQGRAMQGTEEQCCAGQNMAGQGRALVTWDLVMPPFMLRSIRGLTGRPAVFSLSPCIKLYASAQRSLPQPKLTRLTH